ncbi:MAG: fumarate reductase/succinate dehydrogenase flavoprotein subunit, partial [Blastocatellia bacterium]
NLMSNVPGLYVIGEANFSDHGANRLGASALMQGLADGYFILPYTIGHYFATEKPGKPSLDSPEFKQVEQEVAERTDRFLSIKGHRTVTEFHRELGKLMWDKCGMGRNEAGLTEALEEIPVLRREFWEDVNVLGDGNEMNQSLEYAGRVADFMEFAELLVYDALKRDESCGAHFREEHQTPDGEAKRDDENYSYVAAWEFQGVDTRPILHKEPLVYEEVHPAQRSYK